MATLINRTPHTIRIRLASGQLVELAPTQLPIRCLHPAPTVRLLEIGCGAIEVLERPAWSGAVALPPEIPGRYLIVSAMVARMCPGRRDLLAPATGPGEGAIRDDEGRVVAVTHLSRCVPDPASRLNSAETAAHERVP